MVNVLQALPQYRRVNRNPKHSFQLRVKPWQIQPMCIAPVLPMETMKNLLLQARVVSQPVKNPLLGWWAEYYFFYVKLRDLAGRDDFAEMMLDLNKDMSAYYTGFGSTTNYTYTGGMGYVSMCLQRVVEEYFRNEGETWNGNLIDDKPVAAVQHNGYWDSVRAAGDMDHADDDVAITVGVDDVVNASEIERALQTWQFQRANSLTEMDFEDFLATYGVKPRREELHKPELIRYVKSWTYPTNTIDPTTGAPTSAASWSIAERADKARMFREPGFVFGVQVCRPKVYFSRSLGAGVGMLNNAMSWLPAIMNDDPMTSLKHFADASGPLGDNTDAAGYWIDVRDLFIYGDQFVNFALTETDAGFVALPTTGMQKRYADETMADALFVGTTDATRIIKSDGVVDLTIAGMQRDHT